MLVEKYDYFLILNLKYYYNKIRLLRSERDSLPDVPAIYFISPTPENVARLCQDLKNELYEQYYLNFILLKMTYLIETLIVSINFLFFTYTMDYQL
jgi:hypothetical protein